LFRDLSETAITHLPTWGLESLDVLRIEETESLKVIPSVYSFKVSNDFIYDDGYYDILGHSV
jgi:hypothetical protein